MTDYSKIEWSGKKLTGFGILLPIVTGTLYAMLTSALLLFWLYRLPVDIATEVCFACELTKSAFSSLLVGFSFWVALFSKWEDESRAIATAILIAMHEHAVLYFPMLLMAPEMDSDLTVLVSVFDMSFSGVCFVAISRKGNVSSWQKRILVSICFSYICLLAELRQVAAATLSIDNDLSFLVCFLLLLAVGAFTARLSPSRMNARWILLILGWCFLDAVGIFL